MDELIAAAAAATGMSESMVQRSAAARAKAQGTTVEAVLAGWAGVEVPAGAAAAPAEAPAASEAPAPSSEASAAPAAVAPPAAAAAPEVVVVDEEPPAPAEPPAQPDREVVPAGAIPRWLAALFVVVPMFALAYLAFLPNGPNCGDAGQLAIDPVSGELVECDGSAYGVDEIDYFALGRQIYDSIGCAACHGAGGAGQGNFPAFTGGALLATFPEGSCSTQVEWVRLGTAGWPDATYGANDKPVGGSGAVMPGFGFALSDTDLAAVSLYERVAFGGEDLAAADTDCFPAGG